MRGSVGSCFHHGSWPVFLPFGCGSAHFLNSVIMTEQEDTAKSKNTISTFSPISIQPVTLSRNSKRLVKHDRPLRKPCGNRYLLDDEYFSVISKF